MSRNIVTQASVVSDLEMTCLRAAWELRVRQAEVSALVEATLGVSPFDFWINAQGLDDPALADLSTTRDGSWRFHFHGIEFDAVHTGDSRQVRVDFGARGSLAFTPSGIGSFVLHSRVPWGEYPALRAHIEVPQGYDFGRCHALCDRLRELEFVRFVCPEIVADPDCATKVDDETFTLQRDGAEVEVHHSELLFAHNLIITPRGMELVTGHA